jgi:hypothetical protein
MTEQSKIYNPSALLPKLVAFSFLLFMALWFGVLLLYNGGWPTGIIGVGFIMLIELSALLNRNIKVGRYAPAIPIVMMVIGIANLLWPGLPRLNQLGFYCIIILLLIIIYIKGRKLFYKIKISAGHTTIIKYLVFALLLFLMPHRPEHDVSEIYKDYHILRDNPEVFKDWLIERRGGAAILTHRGGGCSYTVDLGEDTPPYDSVLGSIKLFLENYGITFMNYEHANWDSVGKEILSTVKLFDDINAFYVYGHANNDIPGIIIIGIDDNDILYYTPDSMNISDEFYNYLLRYGEVMKLDGNWYYKKK